MLCLYDQILFQQKESTSLQKQIEDLKAERNDMKNIISELNKSLDEKTSILELKSHEQSQNTVFLEDCIAEMAAIIYA